MTTPKPFPPRRLWLAALCLGSIPALTAAAADSPRDGLLFYLSADHGTTADVAFPGSAQPNFQDEITQIPDGARGPGLSAGNTDRLAYWAPGNLYAERGTLSFFWRSRTPVGPTPFPIFRVGEGDSSTWDMVWLRVDYNGHGFDAFVTDASLSRIRVSVPVTPFPGPKEWTHLALTWDETQGIRFYVNGRLAAQKKAVSLLYQALDQFGPTSRTIGPMQVQSAYNFDRGEDVDEIKTFDRALTGSEIATLAKGDAVTGLAPMPARSLENPRFREEWYYRYGWNRPDDPPPALPADQTTVRKVEITDAYDHGRWWWKATDGIRETTWPAMYNRSRLPGRNDYFQLPDWDCYVDSGKWITFDMPDEPWNTLEISGSAWGSISLLDGADANDAPARELLFERPQGQERTFHRLSHSITGHKVRFANVEQEQPIGEFDAFNVVPGTEPAGSAKLSYRLASVRPSGPSLQPLADFIAGRYLPDERTTMVAEAADAPADSADALVTPAPGLPIVHILIPNESSVPGYRLDAVDGGLDGIALDLPALNIKPTHGDLIPLNIKVMDPLWNYRDMLDFSFSVRPGEAKTLWLDLRDRILPPGKALYLTIASASGEFGPASLAPARIRLVFKPRAQAMPEHTLDRFTQARDSYAWLVEEHPRSPKLNTWVRFTSELDDLLRVDPNNRLGREYYAEAVSAQLLSSPLPTPPAGVPLWAFRQVDLLGRVQKFVEWYIDKRQSSFGDFGGGISDDDDFTNMWPGVALMGANPPKIKTSLRRLLDACYNNGMFTNGLPTIQADELHSYEEGIEALGEDLILDYGNPTLLERAMETQRGVESITGVNSAGHRHIMTCYYNGRKIATDGVWGWSKPASYLVVQPGELIANYNGNPRARKIIQELADGLLAHRRLDPDGHYATHDTIEFKTDRDLPEGSRMVQEWPIFWSSWLWTGDHKYLDPILDGGLPGVAAVNADTLDMLGLRQRFGSAIMKAKSLRNEGGRGGRPVGAAGPAGATRVNEPQGNDPFGFMTTSQGTSPDQLRWQITGDKKYLEDLYGKAIQKCVQSEFIETEGSLWIDRIGLPYTDLQRARLGGIALTRGGPFPGHVASWVFRAPATDQSVAILIPNATPTAFKVIAYNLDSLPVHADMTGWNINPGIWEITQGTSSTNGDEPDSPVEARQQVFENTRSVGITFAPRTTTILTFTLKTPGTPYWQRPDLGIAPEDVRLVGNNVIVRVHNLGSVPSPETTLVFRDSSGRVVATAPVPTLAPPVDLFPKTEEIDLDLPAGVSAAGGSVQIDPEHRLEEITRINNTVQL